MAQSREQVFREALLAIRDSTFRNAMQLRAIAQRALESGDLPDASDRDAVRDSLANIKGGRW